MHWFIKNSAKYSFVFLLFLVISCEKDVTIVLPKPERKLVVEGQISLGEHPYVLLTKSSAYFDPVDSAVIVNTVVSNAEVIVSDGIITDTMQLTLDPVLFPPIVYKSTLITGEVGKTYFLTIKLEGKTYTSTTTIPQPIPLDSVWFKLQPPSDSLGFAWAHLSEPVGFGNYYRWFAKRIGKDLKFVPPFGSAFDDKFIDGQSFDYGYNRGSEFNSTAKDDNNEERGYFKKTDTIVIKFCTIDRASFEYYKSFETEAANNGNPFAAPSTIKTNIQGGAIGCWAGYGVSLDTIFPK